MSVAILLITLAAYLVASRVTALRRHRRIIVVTGLLLFLASVYVDRNEIRDAFLDGWRAGIGSR